MINLILDMLLGWLIEFIQILFSAVFSTDLTTMLKSFQDPDTINGIIPHFKDVVNAMSVMGYMFLALCAYSIIIKALIAQFGGNAQTENPIKSMVKVVIAGIFIAGKSYVLNLVAELYSRFGGLMPTAMVKISDLKIWGSMNAVAVFTRTVMLAMFAFAAIGAALAYFERVISFLIFLYTYPIAVAFSVNKDTSDMFRQWLIGVLSQMVLIVLSTGMMYIGIKIFNDAISNDFWDTAVHSIIPFFSIGDSTRVDVFRIILSINALNLVKNAEKILNMYNIRTMPNASTAGEFGSAVGKAMNLGRTAINETGKLVGKTTDIATDVIGGSATGAAAPELGGMGGFHGGSSGMVDPSGSIDPIVPSGGATNATATNATRDEAVKARGSDYATRTAKVQSVVGVKDDSSAADKMKVAEALPPSNPQILQEATNQKLLAAGTNNANTIAGSYLNKVRGDMNLKSFTAGVDGAIEEINKSRDKVNDYIDENKEMSVLGEHLDKNGFEQTVHGEPLKAEDVYKAYGMANDPTLKDFKPEGFAVPMYKDGNLQGLAIKGQQKNARTGEMDEQVMYVSPEHDAGSVGKQGEWRKDGYQELGQNVYASVLKPVNERVVGNEEQRAEIGERNSYMEHERTQTMSYFNAPYPTYGKETTPKPVNRPSNNVPERGVDAPVNVSSPQADKPTLNEQFDATKLPDGEADYGTPDDNQKTIPEFTLDSDDPEDA